MTISDNIPHMPLFLKNVNGVSGKMVVLQVHLHVGVNLSIWVGNNV